MSKPVLIIISVALVIALGVIFTGGKGGEGNNIEIKDGVQYITISARGGYSPRITNAKAGMPTKLIMETSGSYDCSSALVIPSLGYQKMLPQKGETEIDLGIPKAGEPFRGLCSMGMYSFDINFQS